MSSGLSRPLKTLYCLIGIAFLIYSGTTVWTLVMHIWHKVPNEKPVDAQSMESGNLYKAMLPGPETTQTTAIYKNINNIKRRYDFHKTKGAEVPDSQDLCISCHGEIPHDKDRKTRSFLNMHAFFMACETCHIRPEGRARFRFAWYDKTTGEQNDKIDLSRFLANTPCKLMPLKQDGTKVYATDQMMKYVAEFKATVRQMNPSEKRAALEAVHSPMTETKNAVRCEGCHTSDHNTAYLPFRQIGYPQRRADQLAGNEVVGMINKYKMFYMPDFLTPKKGNRE